LGKSLFQEFCAKLFSCYVLCYTLGVRKSEFDNRAGGGATMRAVADKCRNFCDYNGDGRMMDAGQNSGSEYGVDLDWSF
jgi:hypothetical protein